MAAPGGGDFVSALVEVVRNDRTIAMHGRAALGISALQVSASSQDTASEALRPPCLPRALVKRQTSSNVSCLCSVLFGFLMCCCRGWVRCCRPWRTS